MKKVWLILASMLLGVIFGIWARSPETERWEDGRYVIPLEIEGEVKDLRWVINNFENSHPTLKVKNWNSKVKKSCVDVFIYTDPLRR